MDDGVIEGYLGRVGVGRGGCSVAELQLAHVRAVPYDNLDIHLGREIRLDVPSLVGKMVERRRGGYCYEQNTLFAAVLEGLGYTVTRCLGRVRVGDATSPRAATHMVLIVDGQLVDVGMGGATPLGPIPLGGEATYGGFTWAMARVRSPEGEDVWQVSLGDLPIYTFTERPQHPVDYVTPNHYSSTHPQSVLVQNTIVQKWCHQDGRDVQVGLVGFDLTERYADGTVEEATIEPGELGTVLSERFGLHLNNSELAELKPIRAR